ncbi:MAG: histidine kinase N-terminal domain-containing protein, partial [Acidobacteriota bacterium]|nr:histidine kinase N-terminal domain-containing protein [Acidobacteriota bacterium]
MATLAELAALRTRLDKVSVDHLVRLVASWSLLADLAFSDLLLMTRVAEPENRGEKHLVVVGQVRPNNRSTLLGDDLVGTTQRVDAWPLVQRAFEERSLVVGEGRVHGVDDAVSLWCVPVIVGGEVAAVMVRLQGPTQVGAALYEKVYLSLFERMCAMVSDGSFPFREEDVAGPGMPRVGDGVIL